MNIKSLVPTVLLIIVIAALAYSAGKGALPGEWSSDKDKQNEHIKSQALQQKVAENMSPAELEEVSKVKALILKSLQSVDNSIESISIEQSPVAGVYWVLLPNNETVMMSADGIYLLGQGVNKVTGGRVEVVNGELIAQAKIKAQQQVINAFSANQQQQIIYPAAGDEKAEIFVFTDVNCGYCRKFHRDVPVLNTAGITVHYFAGPFFSKDRESLEQIWCASDPLLAMTQVKQGQKLKGVTVTELCKKIVTDHIALGQSLGIRGTPAIYTKDGMQIGGYVEPKKLIEMLTSN